MKTKLTVLLVAAFALTGGAFANTPAARLSVPANPNAAQAPSFAPATPVSGCATMPIASAPVKAIASNTYGACDSATVRNSAECKRHCEKKAGR